VPVAGSMKGARSSEEVKRRDLFRLMRGAPVL
jgi:hypothetical protein